MSTTEAEADASATDALLPGLYVVGTPLGNLGDITLRALSVLRGVEAMACEDTRRTWKLLTHYAIPRPRDFFACHDSNERRAVGRVLGLLDLGRRVALVSDAGMPLISDPGFIISRAARTAGHPVTVIPGPTAAVTGLVSSGLPVHAFAFKGFPPRKSGQRRRFLELEQENTATLIFYVSPHQLAPLLQDAVAVFGPQRPAALCLELTKKFERVERDTLATLAEKFQGKPPNGELTLIVQGHDPRAQVAASRRKAYAEEE